MRHLTATYITNSLTIKKISKSIIIWRSYGPRCSNIFGPIVLCHPLVSVKQYAVGILVVQMYCYIRNTDEWTQGLIGVGMGMHLNLLSFEYHVNVFSLLLSLAPFHTDLKTFSRGSCLRKFTLVLAPPDGRLISLPISKS